METQGKTGRKRLQLTGARFGRLTVLGPAPNIGSRTAWRCRCDCGGELTVKTYHLRSGQVRSCGCLTPQYIDGTCVEILRKNPVRSNNTSGVTGVQWYKPRHRWRAHICFKGHRYYLGEYARFEDAVQARKEAERRTHGAFLAYIDSLQSNHDVPGP